MQIFFMGTREENEQIWAHSLKDGAERPLTDLSGKKGEFRGGAGFATDGKYLYFTWRESLGDIWVMDVGHN